MTEFCDSVIKKPHESTCGGENCLQIIRSFRKLRIPALLAVYQEGDLSDPASEEKMLAYLREDFFGRTGGLCVFLPSPDGGYAAALRMEPWEDGFLITGLQVRCDLRRAGWGTSLLRAVQRHFSARLYAHVFLSNTVSLRFHASCGFRLYRDTARFLDGTVTAAAVTLLWEPPGDENS